VCPWCDRAADAISRCRGSDRAHKIESHLNGRRFAPEAQEAAQPDHFWFALVGGTVFARAFRGLLWGLNNKPHKGRVGSA
jgi:hypothetical protein